MSGNTSDSLSGTGILFGILFILFILLGTLGLLIEFRILAVTILWLTILWLGYEIYGRVLKTKRETLSDERETLIRNANGLDTDLSRLSDSTVESSWKELAATIPTPSLSPFTQSAVQARLGELQSKVEQRREVLRELEDLLERHDLVEINCEHEIPPIQTYAIVQQISQADPKQVDSAQSEIALENSKLTIHAFHEVKGRNQALKQTNTETLIDSIVNTDEKAANTESLQTLAELMAKLVTIERYQPEIQTIQGVKRLNIAIGDLENIPKAESTIATLYQLLEFTQRIDNLLANVDLTHTSLTPEECKTQVESAISASDPSQLDGLLTKIDQIVESSWEQVDLYKFDWQSFEHLIGDLWADKGYETTVTVGSADEGIDVRAIRTTGTPEHVIIQVKQYRQDSKVGRPAIQKTLGTLSTDIATRAIVVTSSSFTQPAITEAAKAGHRIELINGADLLKLLSKSDIAPPTENNKNNRSHKYVPQYNVEQTIIEVLQNQETISDISKQAQSEPLEQQTKNTARPEPASLGDSNSENTPKKAETKNQTTQQTEKSSNPSDADHTPNRNINQIIESVNDSPGENSEHSQTNPTEIPENASDEPTEHSHKKGVIDLFDHSSGLGAICSEGNERMVYFQKNEENVGTLQEGQHVEFTATEINSELRATSIHKLDDENQTSIQASNPTANQDAFSIKGEYLLIELLGCEQVQGTVITPGPYSEPEDKINGLVIALNIQHTHEELWYFSAAKSLEIVDSESTTYQPNPDPFGFADLPSPWRYSLIKLSPNQSYKYVTTVENFQNPIQKIAYRADPAQTMQTEADNQLSMDIDRSPDDLPDLPEELQAIIEYE